MGAETTPVFLQYGALGLLTLVCILAVRVLFQQNATFTKQETERADRNEEALRVLNQSVQEKVIPAALEMVTATRSMIELMTQMQAERRRRDDA